MDFAISDADMETLRNAEAVEDCGEASVFPVFGRRRRIDSTSGAAAHGAGMQRGTFG